MSERPAREGRLVPVSLLDVPLAIRERVGLRLLDQIAAQGGARHDVFELVRLMDEAAEMRRAIETPSDRKVWLPQAAVERVLGAGR